MATGKTELVKEIAQKTGMTQKQGAEFLNAFLETVEEKLSKGEKVQLVGFGTFAARNRDAREGMKPGTGEKITIPASVVPSFKAGKGLKEKLNA